MNNSTSREMMGSMVSKREENADLIPVATRERQNEDEDSKNLMALSYKMDTLESGLIVTSNKSTDGFLASIPMPPPPPSDDDTCESSSSSAPSSSLSSSSSSSSSSSTSSLPVEAPCLNLPHSERPTSCEPIADSEESPRTGEPFSVDHTNQQVIDSTSSNLSAVADQSCLTPTAADTKVNTELTPTTTTPEEETSSKHSPDARNEEFSNVCTPKKLSHVDQSSSPPLLPPLPPHPPPHPPSDATIGMPSDNVCDHQTSIDFNQSATPNGSLSASNTSSTPSSVSSSESQDSSKRFSRWDRGFALQRTPEKSLPPSAGNGAPSPPTTVSPTVVMARGVRRGLSFTNNLGFRMCYKGFSLRFGNSKLLPSGHNDLTDENDRAEQPLSDVKQTSAVHIEPVENVDPATEEVDDNSKSEQSQGMGIFGPKTLLPIDDELKSPASEMCALKLNHNVNDETMHYDDRDVTAAATSVSFQKPKVGKFKFLASAFEMSDDLVREKFAAADGGSSSSNDVLCNGLSVSSTRSDDSDSGGACNVPSSATSEVDDYSTPTDSQSDSGARDGIRSSIGREVDGNRKRGASKRCDKKGLNEERRRSSRIRNIAERREKEREERQQIRTTGASKSAIVREESVAIKNNVLESNERVHQCEEKSESVVLKAIEETRREHHGHLATEEAAAAAAKEKQPATDDSQYSKKLDNLTQQPASAPLVTFRPPPPPPPPTPPPPLPAHWLSDNINTMISVDLIPLPPMPPPPRQSYQQPSWGINSAAKSHSPVSTTQRRQNSSSPTSGGEDGGGAGGRPEKVKSRWRRNSELERVWSNSSSSHVPRSSSEVYHGCNAPSSQRHPPPPPPPTSATTSLANCVATNNSSARPPPFDILLNGGLMGSVLGGPPPPPPPVCGFFDPGEITEDWSEKEVTSSLSRRPLPQRPRVNQVSQGTTIGGAAAVECNTESSKLTCSSATSAKLTSNVVATASPKEKPAYMTFEEIAENTYLSERRRSKSKREVRRMVCDCTITKDEVDEGFIACGDDCLNRLLMMECGSRCPTGERCTNRRFQKRQYGDIVAFKTEKKGWGLKTQEDLPAGSFVLEYVGEVLDQREFKRRVKEYAHDRHRHYYFMALRNDEIIDATQRGNLSRFINHSCDPNCETQKWTVNGDLRVGFFTRRSVSAGDELTFDYQFQRYGKEAQRCYCESSNCRGFIGGDKQTPLKKDRRDVKKKKAAEERRREELEDMDLEEEIEKFSHLGGLKNRTQTLNLCRLMVRAEDTEFRLALLQSLQKTTEQACLRLFLDYHGLSLVWSWMVDISNTEENLPLKSEILKTLQKLPISNKNVLMDSKVMSVVERWAIQIAEQTHRVVNKSVSLEEDPLPPTLTKENGLATATEDSCSDTDSIQRDASVAAKDTPNRESNEITTYDFVDSEVMDAINDEAPNDDVVSKVEVTTDDVDCKVDDGAVSLTADDANGDDLPSCTTSAVTNEVEDDDDVHVKTEKEEGECVLADCAVEVDELTSTLEENELESALEEGELVSVSDGGGDLCVGTAAERVDISVISDSADELAPPVLNNEAQLAEQSRKVHEEGEFASLAKDLLESWSSLKEVYRIPKREQNQNRREHEREADKREGEERERDHRDRGRDRDKDQDRDGRQDRHRDRYDYDQRSKSSGDYDRGRRSRDGRDSPSNRDQRKSRDRGRRGRGDDDEPERKRCSLHDDSKRQSKVERRREFELRVQQEEEQAVMKQQAEDYLNHCRHMHEAHMMSMDPMYYDPNYGTGGPIHAPPPPPGTPMPFFEHNSAYVMPPPMPMGPPPDQVVMVSAIPTPDAIGECTTPSATASPVPIPGATPAQIIYPVYPPPGATPVPPGYVGPTPPGPAAHFIPPQGQPIYFPPPQAVVNLPDQIHPWPHVIPTSILEESPPPPEPPKPVKLAKLPVNWRTAKDLEGAVYYYHTLTRQVQWDAPVCEESDMDLGTPTYDEPKKKKRTGVSDTSSESARRIKEGFRMKMSQFIVQCLNPYRKPDCKLGHISSTEEFKHLARKLTHFVMAKELKHCRNVEDLECNENVKHKAKDFVRKYMSKFGPVYKKSPKDDDDDED